VAEENLWGKPEAALDAEPATPFAIEFRNGLVEDVYDLE